MSETIPERESVTDGRLPGGRDSDAGDGLPGLELPASGGDREVTRAQLDRWAKLYGTEHRQLRRWIRRGKENDDPCPLDDARRMPAWIEANLGKVRSSLRETVNAAASAAVAVGVVTAGTADAGVTAAEDRPFQGQNGGGETVAKVSESDFKKSQISTTAGNILPSLDLATVGGVEGESVEFFRVIFAAVRKQLGDAYMTGVDNEIRKLHARLKEVGEALRKHEKDAEQRAIRLGSYLDKAEVFNEVTEALNTLVRLREHRGARVRGELADLPGEVIERVCRELDLVGRREEDVLRSLSAMRSLDDVSLKLVA